MLIQEKKNGRFGARRLVLGPASNFINHLLLNPMNLWTCLLHRYIFYVILNKVKTSSMDAASWMRLLSFHHVWSGCVRICQKVEETSLSTLILSRETSISGELICGKQQKIKGEKTCVEKRVGSSYFCFWCSDEKSFQDDFNMIKMFLVVNITQEDDKV